MCKLSNDWLELRRLEQAVEEQKVKMGLLHPIKYPITECTKIYYLGQECDVKWENVKETRFCADEESQTWGTEVEADMRVYYKAAGKLYTQKFPFLGTMVNKFLEEVVDHELQNPVL